MYNIDTYMVLYYLVYYCRARTQLHRYTTLVNVQFTFYTAFWNLECTWFYSFIVRVTMWIIVSAR